ncbi:pyridoxamine 5'-phosphate oxidase family protein [Variovorax sp. PCZ-1]|uniref:HugZ family pyridoxamine 5'-phosphate oxidase n=1 Tax=Variovorax sp. PCZ-1 TaxID=2835533 RepID=UPI001BD0B5FC|nr:pyridoxamine 5'-phosphate oxidase family protein [Variovorax sp. PCZ-1]MBS7806242.1 HugZ family protein [Variovorax sp. PCZ-1]
MSQSSSPDKPQVLRETDDAARLQARSFVRESTHGALATLEPGTGWPLASRVSLAVDADGTPLILISRLSAHYGALEADARCSLLLGEAGEGDPLRHPRITVVCLAQKIPSDQRAVAKEQFLKRHPGAEMYADFADFDFWALVPQRASLNAGFGKAYSLTADDLK